MAGNNYFKANEWDVGMALVAILIGNDDFIYTALDGHKGHPYIFYINERNMGPDNIYLNYLFFKRLIIMAF